MLRLVVWQAFLDEVLEAAGMDAEDVTFMMDKSSIEMKAVRAIGAILLLCHFHMLQEADRFLRSSASEMHGSSNKALRVGTLIKLQQLQKVTDESGFKACSKGFKDWLLENGLAKVHAWYVKNWEPDSKMWAGEVNGRVEQDLT